MYKTIVTEYLPKAKMLAAKVEEEANQMEAKGYRLETFSITGSGKGILVFYKPDKEPGTK